MMWLATFACISEASMADGLGIEWTGEENVLEFYARLKDVPVWKVLRNAGKDMVMGAWKVTPKARPTPGPSKWAMVPGRGSKADRYVKIDLNEVNSVDFVRLVPYRVARPRAGYALAAFIPAMKALGFKKKKPPKSAGEKDIGKIPPFFKTRTSGGDEFKEKVSQFRLAHTHARTPGDYSYAIIGKNPNRPVTAVTIKERALSRPRYEGWAGKALRSGLDRAADNLIRDLLKLMAEPESPVPEHKE